MNDATNKPSDSFAELLDRIRQGDQEALTQLVQQYEGRVRAAAHVLLGPALRPHLDSIDVTQSVHRTLLDGLKENRFSFTSQEELFALLMTVVRRKVAHQWRRAQRQAQAIKPSESDLAKRLAALGGDNPTAESAVEMDEAVKRLLENLSGVERQMIELRLQGYRTVEVAQQLGLDARVLRARLSRLRQRLRREGLLSEWL